MRIIFCHHESPFLENTVSCFASPPYHMPGVLSIAAKKRIRMKNRMVLSAHLPPHGGVFSTRVQCCDHVNNVLVKRQFRQFVIRRLRFVNQYQVAATEITHIHGCRIYDKRRANYKHGVRSANRIERMRDHRLVKRFFVKHDVRPMRPPQSGQWGTPGVRMASIPKCRPQSIQ